MAQKDRFLTVSLRTSVETRSGELAMDHIVNSVRYSSRVCFGHSSPGLAVVLQLSPPVCA